MEVSRIIFSKKTKKKMENGLNSLELGKLRFNKLKELQEEGRLGYARNRYELAKLLGFTEQQKTKGYQWVSNNINRKHIIERVFGLNKDGKMEFEYSVGSEPDFDRKNARKALSDRKHSSISVDTIKNDNDVDNSSSRKMTNRQRGRKLYNKLSKLSESGELDKIRSRKELASVLNSRIGWVGCMVGRGYLKETIQILPNGDSLTSYKLTGIVPDYNYTRSGNRKASNRPEQAEQNNDTAITENTKIVEPEMATPVDEPIVVEKASTQEPIKIEVSRGDITVKIEFIDYTKVGELITTILKGE